MSGKNLAGDLVPRDITEVLALESKTNKSKRKQGASFSRAFSWLRGTKRKSSSNGQSRGGRAGEGRVGKHTQHDPNSARAASKQEDERKLTVHYTASQHFQENVFIEGSRPQYLEDLHTEAQEGLKILQQEGHNNGTDYEDGQSTTSAAARLQPEEATDTQESTGSQESGSTTAEPASPRLTTSARSGLVRQGSTFKPLNPVKRLDKGRKRSRRTTIMGIPHHVQKELGLERGQLFRQNADGQLRNGREDVPGIVVIPTIDGEVKVGTHEGARVHLQDLEAQQTSKEDELLKRHIQAVYRDDQVFNRKEIPGMSPIQRPKSLAVPGLTTSNFLQEPQGPVMSISPQATYLSKIIPNAIMPAAVDVIEISRSRSRSSVRTVSKSNLATASPASSRSSMPKGLSSTSSSWSHSQSSETIISNSSTISSKGSASTPHAPNDTEEAIGLSDQTATDQVSISSSTSWVSSDSTAKQRAEMQAQSSRRADDAENEQNDQSFVRSLSIVKTKMPPAPPRRTYSLHHEKIKRRSREFALTKGVSDSKGGNVPLAKGGKTSNAVGEALSPGTPSSAGSPAYSADSSSLENSRSSAASSPLNADQTANSSGIPAAHPLSSDSSPHKLPSPANQLERTMSPSSGYSSQSGTPTLSAKEICPPSPGKKKAQPVKPERTGTRSSPAVSISSSLTSLSSGTSDPTHQEAPANQPPAQLPKPPSPAVAVSTKVTPAPAAVTLRDMFDIPPPPKVKAPSPPPPETWTRNSRTFELLYGANAFSARIAALQKQQQRKESPQLEKPAGPKTESNELSSAGTHPQKQDETAILSGKEECTVQSKEEPISAQKPDHSLECTSESLSVSTVESLEVQMKEDKSPMIEKKERASLTRQRQENEAPVTQQKEKESPLVVKKEPPPVMRKNIPVVHIKEPDKAVERLLVQSTETATEVKIHTPPLEEMFAVQREESTPKDTGNSPNREQAASSQSSMQTLSVDVPKLTGVSPPPSPPPAHHPPPPPSKKTTTTTTSVSSSMNEDNMETLAAESSWPPPPPPMVESSGLVFEEQDEIDFPPPPPPILQDPLLDRVESSSVITEIHEFSVTSEGPIKTEESTSGATSELTMIDSSHSDTSIHVQLCPSLAHENNECSSQEDPPMQIEASPLQEGSPLRKEAIPPPQELHHQEKPALTHSEAQPVPEYIPPPPQEAPPLPPLVPGVTLSASPANSALESSMPPPHLLPMNVQHALPLPVENQTSVAIKRQPSLANRASKDQLSRTKSVPMPKEDANIPLVTPSLLQMVRLRSVNIGDDQVLAPCEDDKPSDGTSPIPDQNHSFNQSVPQKPIRKSLSVKSPTGTAPCPSMRLQEAIRMKTAAMSSRDGLPAKLSLRSSVCSTSSGEMGVRSLRLPEGDLPKSPASTASFIFSRSTKKVVIETPSSPEAQSNLKQSLVAELMQVSDQTKLASTNGKPSAQIKKPGKVPPPVAKKPALGPNLSDKPVHPTENMGNSTCQPSGSSPMGSESNEQTEGVQSAGQQAQPEEGQNPASHQETVTLGY